MGCSSPPSVGLWPQVKWRWRSQRDAFPFINRLEKYSNVLVHPVWRNAWQQKEEALRQWFHHIACNGQTKPLPNLWEGDQCYIQNQTGPHPKRCDWSGTVVEDHGHSSYTLKIYGIGYVIWWNRRYLRKLSDITNNSLVNKQILTSSKKTHIVQSTPKTVELSTSFLQPTLIEEGPTTAQQSPSKLLLPPTITTEVPHLADEQHFETTQNEHHITTQGTADTDTVSDLSDASPNNDKPYFLMKTLNMPTMGYMEYFWTQNQHFWYCTW